MLRGLKSNHVTISSAKMDIDVGFIRSGGTQGWYRNNQLHRLDGPVLILAEDKQYWYIDGKEYSKVEFDQFVKSRK